MINKSENTWELKDILLIILSLILSVLLLFIITYNLFSEKTAEYTFIIIGDLLQIGLPIWWIKKKYGLKIEALGITKGRANISKIIIIGLFSGIIYFFITYPFFIKPYLPQNPPILLNKSNFIWLFLEIFTVRGFTLVILSPICEEVMNRGFIYPYLRRRFGLMLGLVFQAIIFSLIHIDIFHGFNVYLLFEGFLFQTIAGILYEKTGSLYPSMIFHGCFNYLLLIKDIIF